MTDQYSLTAIILAAGKGTRMCSTVPKILHSLGGRPVVDYVVDTALALKVDHILTVTSPNLPLVEAHFATHQEAPKLTPVLQDQQLGTGHAVQCTAPHYQDTQGDIIILFGDTPLLQPATIQRMQQLKAQEPDTSIVVLGMEVDGDHAYARLAIQPGTNIVERIIEDADATEAEKALTLCNSGVMLLSAETLRTLLPKVDNKNAKGEYYLTDLVYLARQAGQTVRYLEAPEWELMGINSRLDLAEAEALLQDHWRAHFLQQGVTMIDPQTVYLSYDTQIDQDVTLYPNQYIGPGVTIAANVTLLPNCVLADTDVAAGSTVGPFAHLRPGTSLGPGAKVGNFVELKKCHLGQGSKVSHLSYLGDTTIGAQVNIGAGTITCNYDGYQKHQTTVEDNAFIGSNTALVAPITIGKGTIVAAGSTLTKDVAAGELAHNRTQQSNVANAATRFHQKHQQKEQK